MAPASLELLKNNLFKTDVAAFSTYPPQTVAFLYFVSSSCPGFTFAFLIPHEWSSNVKSGGCLRDK